VLLIDSFSPHALDPGIPDFNRAATFLGARGTVAIERRNSGQCDCGNSALESIKLKEILIGGLKAF
jgi:hypothetical protein